MNAISEVWIYVAALLPTAGLAWLFFVVVKNMMEADRNERAAIRQWERQHRARGEHDVESMHD